MRYHISDLERLSGIKAHTIRIWEKRYNLFVPYRTSTNIRYYDDKHLRKLLNIVTLNNAGYKISKLCELDSLSISNLMMKIQNDQNTDVLAEKLISDLIFYGVVFDKKLFNDSYDNTIETFGIEDTYEKIILPMLNKLGLLWLREEILPSQEHFISNILKQKVYSAIDRLENINSEEKWMVFLPENEQHEIGLLFANYLLLKYGKEVINLGPNFPYENVLSAINNIKPKKILTFLTLKKEKKDLACFLDMINQIESSIDCFVVGSDKNLSNLYFNNKVKLITHTDDFLQNIKN